MTSEDVIHSFYIPAFRIKKDVLPGRYTSLWFEPTKVGQYHLFCAEYCGTEHSRMIGWVHVMEPKDYENWLTGGAANEPMEVAGQRLFEQYACHTCHKMDGQGRGPSLVGVFGKSVALQSGSSVVVNEAYIRESVLTPAAKVVAGYQPIMPTFKGQVSEEGIMQLITYIKSLKSVN
jgi:cytochrome c oxidase subunit 2